MQRSRTLLFLMAVLVFVACKPTVPRKFLQPGEMEDILYDCFVAEAMAGDKHGSEAAYNSRLYRLAVLKKHGIDEARFDSSLVYYMRHTDRMKTIYERLSERLNDEAIALGADASEINKYKIEEGDTADIWRGERSLMLTPHAPYNVLSFNIPADSTFHKGDRLILNFNTMFLFQEGTRNGMAMLAVRFSNDSIGTRSMHMSSNTHYTMEVANHDTLGIKEVKGFFFLEKDRNSTATTLKLMNVNNISLIRFHERPKAAAETHAVEADSAATLNPEPMPRPEEMRPEDAEEEAMPLPDEHMPPPDRHRPLPPEGRPLPPDGKHISPAKMSRRVELLEERPEPMDEERPPMHMRRPPRNGERPPEPRR